MLANESTVFQNGEKSRELQYWASLVANFEDDEGARSPLSSLEP